MKIFFKDSLSHPFSIQMEGMKVFVFFCSFKVPRRPASFILMPSERYRADFLKKNTEVSMRFVSICLFCLFVLMAGSAWGVESIDWASIDPALEGASPVEDTSACEECHEEYFDAYKGTVHARVLRMNLPEGAGNDCEVCHGPMSKHDDEALDLYLTKKEPTVFSFKSAGTSPAEKSRVCIRCHRGGGRIGWRGGAHESSGVSCDSCHYVMERRSDTNLQASEDATKACLDCHLNQKGQILKSAHMPVREGKMDCAACHDPHGSARGLLKEATVNLTCYRCHQDKRGPFLWEHAPAREDCSNCHEPHGSNNPGMLTAKGAFLCLRCHQYGGHVNLPRYNRQSATVGQGCINCHRAVHGSNHPSGAKFTR